MVGLLAVTALNGRTSLLQRVPPGKAREFLIEQAREVIKKTGYSPGADSAFGFGYDSDLVQYFVDTDKTRNRWNKAQALNPVFFWYRGSPRPLEHLRSTGPYSTVTGVEPPMVFSGEVIVRLDGEGRLRGFLVVPPERESSTGPPPAVDWTPMFSEAGLDLSSWTPVEPEWIPLYYADNRVAWKGSLPEAPDIPVRVEATSYRGKPVSFGVFGPWSKANRMVSVPLQTAEKITNAIFVLLLIACVGGGLFFARRNLRLGRGDKRGATRLALFVIGLMTLGWLLIEHHVPTYWELYLVVIGFAGYTLWMSGFIWIVYIALEPSVRRRWPQVLVSWTRLLAGEWRDPLVGRDILVGCVTGVGVACGQRMTAIAPTWFGHPEEIDFTALISLEGSGPFMAHHLYLPVAAIGNAVAALFLLFLLRALLRKEHLPAVVLALVVAATGITANAAWIVVPAAFLFSLLFLFVLIRFGLVAAILSDFVYIVTFGPLTLNTSAWYFGSGFATLLIVLAVTLYGFRISLGSRPLLDLAGVEG